MVMLKLDIILILLVNKMNKPKSVSCWDKKHNECKVSGCECNCHHDDNCECFGCKIKHIGFGQVPGGYKSNNPSVTSSKDDF